MDTQDEKNYLTFLTRLLKTDSQTKNKSGVNKVADILQDQFDPSIFSIKRYSHDMSGDLLVVKTRRNTPSSKLLISGHMDTVLQSNDVPVSVKGKWLTGSGANDMKSALVSLIYAINLIKDKVSFSNLVFIFSPDEEVGSQAHITTMKKYYKKADYALVLEGQGDNGELCIKRRGIGLIDIAAKGKPGHSGHFANTYPNAIEEVSTIISKLTLVADRSEGLTINAGKIEGGVAPNVVAENCTANLDVRFRENSQFKKVEKICDNLQEEKRYKESDIKIQCRYIFPPMNPNSNSRKLETLVEKACNNINRKYKTHTRDSASDGNIMSSLGVGTIDGFGTKGKYIHTNKEKVYIPSIFESGKLLSEVIKEFLVLSK